MVAHTASPPPLPLGRFEGRSLFEEALRVSIEQAAAQGWRNLCWMDADFADWPLGERRVESALQAWSQSGRRMTMLAKRYDSLQAKHHRFVAWRRQWAHIIECWQCASADPLDFPSAVLAPGWALQRLDRERSVCVAFTDASRIVGLHELRSEWQGKSAPGFPATVLGL